MRKIYTIFLMLAKLIGPPNTIFSEELPMLYEKNCDGYRSTSEQELIEHVKLSLKRALSYDSKLTGTSMLQDTEIRIHKFETPLYHLLNNLNSLKGSSHLHVGLLKGGSFIAALYENQELLNDQIGIDWFSEFPEVMFYVNCNRYLDPKKYLIIDSNCFQVDKSIFTFPIDIYFYDADHSLKAHEKAFTFYNDIFADVFVAVVDDWKCPWIRRPTFKAFEKLGYQILYQDFIPASDLYGNGQYICVIRKSILSK